MRNLIQEARKAAHSIGGSTGLSQCKTNSLRCLTSAVIVSHSRLFSEYLQRADKIREGIRLTESVVTAEQLIYEFAMQLVRRPTCALTVVGQRRWSARIAGKL